MIVESLDIFFLPTNISVMPHRTRIHIARPHFNGVEKSAS